MWFAEKIPASRVIDLFLEPIVPLQEVSLEEVPLQEAERNEMVSYQEHGLSDVDEQVPGTVHGVNWAEKHGPVIVDGPPDVELHGPSNVNWVDNVVHVRVNKEAGNNDKGNQVLEKGQGEGEAESEAEGQAESEVEG